MPLSRLAYAGSAALAFALAGCGSESPSSPDLSPTLGVTRGGGEGQYILSAAGAGLPAIEELIALIEHDGDGVAGLRAAGTTLAVLLGILESADRD